MLREDISFVVPNERSFHKKMYLPGSVENDFKMYENFKIFGKKII